MIARDLLPWMFVRRDAAWTPFAKIRTDAVRSAGAALDVKPARRPPRRPPRG